MKSQLKSSQWSSSDSSSSSTTTSIQRSSTLPSSHDQGSEMQQKQSHRLSYSSSPEYVISEEMNKLTVKLREIGKIGAFPFSDKKRCQASKDQDNPCFAQVCKPANMLYPKPDDEELPCPHQITFHIPPEKICKEDSSVHVKYDPHIMKPHAPGVCPPVHCSTCGKELKGKQQCCMPTADRYRYESGFHKGVDKLEKKPQKGGGFRKFFKKKTSVFEPECIVNQYEPEIRETTRTEQFKRKAGYEKEEAMESEDEDSCDFERDASPTDIRDMLFTTKIDKENVILHKWAIDQVAQKERVWEGPCPTPAPEPCPSDEHCPTKPCFKQHVTYPSKLEKGKREIKSPDQAGTPNTIRICAKSHASEIPPCHPCCDDIQSPKEISVKSLLMVSSSREIPHPASSCPEELPRPCYDGHTAVRKSKYPPLTRDPTQNKPNVNEGNLQNQTPCQKHHSLKRHVAKDVVQVSGGYETEQALPDSTCPHGNICTKKQTTIVESGNPYCPKKQTNETKKPCCIKKYDSEAVKPFCPKKHANMVDHAKPFCPKRQANMVEHVEPFCPKRQANIIEPQSSASLQPYSSSFISQTSIPTTQFSQRSFHNDFYRDNSNPCKREKPAPHIKHVKEGVHEMPPKFPSQKASVCQKKSPITCIGPSQGHDHQRVDLIPTCDERPKPEGPVTYNLYFPRPDVPCSEPPFLYSDELDTDLDLMPKKYDSSFISKANRCSNLEICSRSKRSKCHTGRNKCCTGKSKVWEVAPLNRRHPSCSSFSTESQLSVQCSKSLDCMSHHGRDASITHSHTRRSFSQNGPICGDERDGRKSKPHFAQISRPPIIRAPSGTRQAKKSSRLKFAEKNDLIVHKSKGQIEYKNVSKFSKKKSISPPSKKKQKNKSFDERNNIGSSVIIKTTESESSLEEDIIKEKKQVTDLFLEFLEWQEKEKKHETTKEENYRKKKKKTVKEEVTEEKRKDKKSLRSKVQTKKEEKITPETSNGSSTPSDAKPVPPQRKRKKEPIQDNVYLIDTLQPTKKDSKELKCPTCSQKNISKSSEPRFESYFNPQAMGGYPHFFQPGMPQSFRYFPQCENEALIPKFPREFQNDLRIPIYDEHFNQTNNVLYELPWGYPAYQTRNFQSYPMNEMEFGGVEFQEPLDFFSPVQEERFSQSKRHSAEESSPMFEESVYQAEVPLPGAVERYMTRVEGRRYRPSDIATAKSIAQRHISAPLDNIRKPIPMRSSHIPAEKYMRHDNEKLKQSELTRELRPVTDTHSSKQDRSIVCYSEKYPLPPKSKGRVSPNIQLPLLQDQSAFSQEDKYRMPFDEQRCFPDRCYMPEIPFIPTDNQFLLLRDHTSSASSNENYQSKKRQIIDSEIAPEEYIRRPKNKHQRHTRDSYRMDNSEQQRPKDHKIPSSHPQREVRRRKVPKKGYPSRIIRHRKRSWDYISPHEERRYNQSDKSLVLSRDSPQLSSGQMISDTRTQTTYDLLITPAGCDRISTRLRDIPERTFPRLQYLSSQPKERNRFNHKKSESKDDLHYPPMCEDLYIKDNSFPQSEVSQSRDERKFQKQFYRVENNDPKDPPPLICAATQTETCKHSTTSHKESKTDCDNFDPLPVIKDLEIVKLSKKDYESIFGKKMSASKNRRRATILNSSEEVGSKNDIYSDTIETQNPKEFEQRCSVNKQNFEDNHPLKTYYDPTEFCPACNATFHKQLCPKPPLLQEIYHEPSPLTYCRTKVGIKDDFQVLYPLSVVKSPIKVMHYVA